MVFTSRVGRPDNKSAKMKTTITSFGFLAAASANIIFNYAPLSCNTTSTQMYHGCLNGQDCTDDGVCVAVEEIKYPSSFGSLSDQIPTVQLRAVRDDGRCGKDFGGATCDPKGAYGGCCSMYG
ncbi:hypothetical protein GLAREA_12017 [Glarea lozoyensis ATCC 20868]|uniref:Uncharacterized protein n=1 Tax=Glarea lozoyensis (strain ATCC 20868 / MF5171) TaxID=1116229 RepID=S3D290_GLAL2|nr:uncharacterized protein GLAREA_12017 [Glarea lozoyensis ATCC 20868]EPE31935.1 hypothetical protein GLAREA_12017 [Glarea lozoyensis ATCC 20868]